MTKKDRQSINDFTGDAPWNSLKNDYRILEYVDEVVVPQAQRIGAIVLHKLVDIAGNIRKILPNHRNEQ